MVPRVISLWELMKRFEVHLVFQKFRCFLLASELGGAFNKDPVRERHFVTELRSQLDSLLELCRDAHLPMCSRSLTRLSEFMRLQTDGGMFNASAIERGANMAMQMAEDELSTRSFFAMESSEAEAWDAKKLFGQDISDKFPSTDYELEEESKSFAVGRYTAAVFHLMRVLDIGLCALASSIGADPTNKSWEKILQGIQTKLDENSKATPDGWKDTEMYYSEVSAHFRNLKNAWRNYAMHGREKYDEERAEEIFVHVRAVMKILATRVRE
jgi:hypothetical protein